MMRVTLDIDGTGIYTITKVLCIKDLLNVLFERHDAEMYKTHRGYHLIVHNTDLTYEQVLGLRELLGDDKNRIKLDRELFQKPKQVLFTKKDEFQRILIPWDWVK